MNAPASNVPNLTTDHASHLVRVEPARRDHGIALAREASQSSGMAVFLGLVGYAGSMALGLSSLGVLLALMH